MYTETSPNISIESYNQQNPKTKLTPSRKKGEDLLQFSHAYFLEKGSNLQRYEILDDRESISQDFKDLVIEPYFKDIYSDLVNRSTDPSKGIDKLTIMKTGYISFKNFMNQLLMLFHSNLKQKLMAVFQMYDFDDDGLVHKEDVRIILSHMPLVEDNEFIQQNQNLASSPIVKNLRVLKMKGEQTKEDIQEFLDNVFKVKSTINFEQFCEINARFSSDMFLSLIVLIHSSLPCNRSLYKFKKNFKSKCKSDQNQFFNRRNLSKSSKHSSPSNKSSEDNKIASPILIKNLRPLQIFVNKHAQLSQLDQQSNYDFEEKSSSTQNHLPNFLAINNNSVLKNAKQSSFKVEKKSSKNNIEVGFQMNKTPQQRHQRKLTPMNDKNIQLSAKEIDSSFQQSQHNYNSSNSTSFSSKARSIKQKKSTLPIDNLQCEEDDDAFVEIIKGEVLIRCSDDTFKPIWISIFGKEIYFHLNNDDKGHETMVSVVGVFVKESTPEKYSENKYLFPIKMSFPGHKQRTIYLKDMETREYWMSIFNKVLKTKSVHQFFSIQERLGEGRYGQVRKAVNRITGEEVAVKILKKKVEDLEDLQLQLQEIEILKVCSHPNISQLIDIFESKHHSYLVMELLKGDNMSNYLKARKFELKEARVATLIYQISSAIKYLHDLGIMHRDLKPANILMTDESDQASAKLADFGFSTIVGPSQLLTDGFGSLLFTAPEIIAGCPYGKEIDLWSLGVILHLLLVGEYPFNEQTQDALKKKIVYEKVTYNSDKWESISPEAKLLCEGLLKKNKTKRLTIDQVIESEWFKQFYVSTRDTHNPKINIESIESKCSPQSNSPLSQIFQSPKNTLPALKLSKFALQRQQNLNNQQLLGETAINSINKYQFNIPSTNNIQSKIQIQDQFNQIKIKQKALILKSLAISPNQRKSFASQLGNEIEEFKIE
eukprot:403336686